MSSLSNRRQIIIRAPGSVMDAKTQADLAASFAAQAQIAALAAAASAQGRIYASYAAGNAATTAGQYFFVASGGAYDLYVNGTATPVAKLPTLNVSTGILEITKAAGDFAVFGNSGDANRGFAVNITGAAGVGLVLLDTTSAGYALGFGTDGDEKMRLLGGSDITLQFRNPTDVNRGGEITVTGSAGTGTFAINTTSSGYGLSFQIDDAEKLAIDTAGRIVVTAGLADYANDAAAAAGGIPLKALYRNGSVVMYRVA